MMGIWYTRFALSLLRLTPYHLVCRLLLLLKEKIPEMQGKTNAMGPTRNGMSYLACNAKGHGNTELTIASQVR